MYVQPVRWFQLWYRSWNFSHKYQGILVLPSVKVVLKEWLILYVLEKVSLFAQWDENVDGSYPCRVVTCNWLT